MMAVLPLWKKLSTIMQQVVELFVMEKTQEQAVKIILKVNLLLDLS